MSNQAIIDAIKAKYDRNMRKDLIKNIQKFEKVQNNQALQGGYKILHQIFAYILKELKWNVSDRSLAWKQDPIEILSRSLPQIEQTHWFAGLMMSIQAHIDGKEGFEEAMKGIIQNIK